MKKIILSPFCQAKFWLQKFSPFVAEISLKMRINFCSGSSIWRNTDTLEFIEFLFPSKCQLNLCVLFSDCSFLRSIFERKTQCGRNLTKLSVFIGQSPFQPNDGFCELSRSVVVEFFFVLVQFAFKDWIFKTILLSSIMPLSLQMISNTVNNLLGLEKIGQIMTQVNFILFLFITPNLTSSFFAII